MRRLATVTALAGAICAAGAASAQAAKPAPGYWSGSQSTRFTVNSAATKITEWRNRCSNGPFIITMKVRSDGSFAWKKRVSVMGGRAATLKISGKFMTPTTVTGTVRYGRCTSKFKAKALNPPVPKPVPEPEPAPEPEPEPPVRR